MDRINLQTIADKTKEDKTLMKIQEIVQKGQTWIPKTESEAVRKFTRILPEITIASSGILLKGERIILPDELQLLAIQLAHRGSHPGQSCMERRLRYHFYFQDMNVKVQKFITECKECKLFTDNKCKEPLKSHNVPGKCWEEVAVDLYGPMPSRNHVVVVQDMGSRFPVAKLVSSTSAAKVLPVLSDIYDTYGDPRRQLSDNGPPFNSAAMNNFAEKRNIELVKIPPLHPSSNPPETFMRPLGKAMKIANYNNKSESEALELLLSNYRDTPHPATRLPPATMMYRDSLSGVFPRREVNENVIKSARENDLNQKLTYQNKMNNSKYKKQSNIVAGSHIFVRNYQRRRKFDPTFLPEPYIVVTVMDGGRKLELMSLATGRALFRHPDDVKLANEPHMVP